MTRLERIRLLWRELQTHHDTRNLTGSRTPAYLALETQIRAEVDAYLQKQARKAVA